MLARTKKKRFFYGIVGSIFSATYAYFNGTITTIEKRYKIPSRNTGFISTGNDISSLFISAILAYYAGKGHRPRWIAFGLFAIVAFCLLTSLPHFLYGPGEQALTLTREHGAAENDEMTLEVLELENQKTLCRTNVTAGIAECELEEGTLMPQILLFIGQLVAGVGQSLYYTLGAAFIDDNVKKSKTPALISFSYFLRLLGPAGGYALASFCLKIYISPELHPSITNSDPRWLGAWWLGWLVLAGTLFGFAFVMCMFPKELPRAAVRRRIASERRKRGMKSLDNETAESDEIPASLSDMLVTFKRLLKNIIFMLNNLASIFYYFG
jgi:MFS family permease